MGISTQLFDNELSPAPIENNTIITESFEEKVQRPENPANSMINENSITESISNDQQLTFRGHDIEDNTIDPPKLVKDSK